MHEYSIVTALIEECEKHAAVNGANKVTLVDIKLGVLSGVEPELLKTAFETFKLEGICAEAVLKMNIQPLVIRCQDCDTQSELNERSVVCTHCGSYNTQVVDGEDMMLMQLELEQA